MIFTKERVLAFLFPLFLALPFLNRAYFVDDSYFVEIAHWLKDHPAHPYHFRADDAGPQTRGWEEDGFVRMVNPLAHHYYLALVLKIGGEREWFLRLGCVLLSCFSGLLIFELARRWTQYPLLTTFLTLVTPVQWLTSYSLLIDGTMGFFFIAALFFFIRGAETDSIGRLALSGVCMGLTILSKYPGVLILPVTAFWLFLNWRKSARRWIFAIPWIIGLGFLAAYSAYTWTMYGSPHILAASGRMVRVYGWVKSFSFLVFLTGVTVTPLLAWGVLGLRRSLLAALAVFVLAVFFSTPVAGFTKIQGFLLGLWLVTGLALAIAVVIARDKIIFPRDLFLIGWVLGFILMMAVVMGWVAGRYYVIVAPAVVFLCARLVEIRWPGRARSILQTAAFCVFALTAGLGYADYQQAETSRLLIRDLKENGFHGAPRHFYTGDSFTVSYLKSEGWQACFDGTEFKPGDQILAKEVTMPSITFFKKPLVVRQIAIFDYPSRFPLKVMDHQGSAGFYASVWGALPFTISWGPWERFHLMEVVEVRKDQKGIQFVK